MKKLIFALWVMLLGYMACAYGNVNENSPGIHTKEKTTTLIVLGSQIKDTIASMEKNGWEFSSMSLNKDKTWTLVFIRNSKSIHMKSKVAVLPKEFIIPDGTYIANRYMNDGTVVKIEDTFKDNYHIKRVINGREINLETGKYSIE